MAYFRLKRISSIRRFLTEDAAKTLVTSYILSRLDYCSCLLMGTPNSVIQPLQKIQNFAARLVLFAPCHHHSTPLQEKNCTGFPFQNVLSIKLLVCVSVLKMVLILLISEPLHVYTLFHTLNSSSDTRMLKIQQYIQKTLALDPTFGIHSHKTLDTAQPFHLLKPNWKPSSCHSLFIPTNISSQFLL